MGLYCMFPCHQAYSNDSSIIRKCHRWWIAVPVTNMKKAKEKVRSHKGSAWHTVGAYNYSGEGTSNI